MTLNIRSVPEDAGIDTCLFRDADDELLALDSDGYDRMGLVNRAFLLDVLKKRDLWSRIPVYSDPQPEIVLAGDAPRI